MLVSVQWLSELVDLNGVTPNEIADKLNLSGIEVEAVHSRNPGISGVVIGRTVQVEQHPSADRLKVCQVDIGREDYLTIVCGAPNVAADQRVPVATIGATLPGDFKIKKAKLRGIESQGMICSVKELNLTDLFKGQSEGIWILENEAPIGMDLVSYFGLNDNVLELSLTPNRSDCLSMLGVAYEVAAVLDRSLTIDHPQEAIGNDSSGFEVILSAKECPFYALQRVNGCTVGPSPRWLQNRLQAVGIRPINNIVDITNYVMIETGQPLHAFDAKKLERELNVRLADKGEVLITLDGVKRQVPDGSLLITDSNQVLAIAGVMGGQSTEVTDSTTDILIESAYFKPEKIRVSSRDMGLRTEASKRFEKGVDPKQVTPALHLAATYVEKIAGGTASLIKTTGHLGNDEEKTVILRHEKLENLIGIKVQSSDVLAILKKLRFSVKLENGIYQVLVPTIRQDITQEVDLIEEVARLYGYDKIPVEPLQGEQPLGKRTREQKIRRLIRNTLVDLGINDVLTYSLTSLESEGKIQSLNATSNPIPLFMPLSQEHTHLRTGLLPQLLQVASNCTNSGIKDISIFEIGRTYLTEDNNLNELPREHWELAGVFTKDKSESLWKNQANVELFYMAKGVIEALFTRLGINDVEWINTTLKGFHPGKTAELKKGDQRIGIIGELHPEVKGYNLVAPVCFQLDVTSIISFVPDHFVYQSISRLPSITRDIALLIDKDIPVALIEAGIREKAGELLESITLFDVYTGQQVSQDEKSVAFSLVYRANDRTLTDEEVNIIHKGVIEHMKQEFKAELR